MSWWYSLVTNSTRRYELIPLNSIFVISIKTFKQIFAPRNKELRKRIGELEKFTATNFEKINIDDIKKRISKLENETSKKAGKYELQELKHLFEKLVNFLKRMINRKDKEDVYSEVISDMYNHQIMSEKTFDRITGWDDIKDKEKDDYEI